MNDRSIGELLRDAAGDPPTDIGVPSVLARARRQRMVIAGQVTAAAAVVALGGFGLAALQPGAAKHDNNVQIGSSSTPSAPATTAITTTPRCVSAGSAMHVLSTQGAAGTMRVAVRIVNTSGHTCTVTGYPGMDFYGAHGWMGVRVNRGGFPDISGRPHTVTVRAGGTTYFVFYFSDVVTNGSSCKSFSKAEVTMPNDTHSAMLATTGCLIPTSVRLGPVTAVRPQ